MKTDQEIAMDHAGADADGLVWRLADVLAALAAARAEQRAADVQLFRDDGDHEIAYWLEQQP